MNHNQINLLMEWSELKEKVVTCKKTIAYILDDTPSVYEEIKEALEWYQKQYEFQKNTDIQLPFRAPLMQILGLREALFGQVSREAYIVARNYDEKKKLSRRIGAIKRSLLATGRALNKNSIIAKLT